MKGALLHRHEDLHSITRVWEMLRYFLYSLRIYLTAKILQTTDPALVFRKKQNVL